MIVFNCHQASRALSQAMDDENIPWLTKASLRLHVFICKPCLALKENFNNLRELCRHASEHVEENNTSPASQLSPETRSRIQKAMTTS